MCSTSDQTLTFLLKILDISIFYHEKFRINARTYSQREQKQKKNENQPSSSPASHAIP